MIFYLVYITILMLQPILGHPVSPRNNQDIAITDLASQVCFALGHIPGRLPAIDTLLPLAVHIPNQPQFINELTSQIAVGSANVQVIDFRSNNAGNPQMFGNVYVWNRGTMTRNVEVYGMRNGEECSEPEVPVGARSNAAISWPILPGYTYYLRLLN